MFRRIYETLGRAEFIRVIKTLSYESTVDTYLLLMENPRFLWRAKDIADELGFSEATAYRTVKLLTNVGLIRIWGKVKATSTSKRTGGPRVTLYCYNDLSSVQPRSIRP